MVKTKNDMATYVCTKRFIYNELTKRGFKPYKVAPDMYDCERLVWLYDDSRELRDIVDECYAKRNS